MAKPFGTTVLDLRGIEGKGEGVLAKKTFKAGVEVLREDPLLYLSGKRSVCDSCLSECVECKRCIACKHVWYCSRKCQKAGWSAHRLECKYLKNIPEAPPNGQPHQSFRFVGQCVVLAESQGSHGILPEMEGMVAHLEEYKRNSEVIESLMFILRKYFGGSLPIDQDTLVLTAAKLACNSMSICNAEMQSVGTALYSQISKINHSCNPNCVIIFNGKTACLRTVLPVAAGDELTISYIDLLQTLEDRQAQLKMQYHFQCRCEVCSTADEEDRRRKANTIRKFRSIEGGPSLDALQKNSAALPDGYSVANVDRIIKDLGDASSDQDALSALKSAEKFLQGVGSVLGENSPHRCHMLNVASDRCCDLQRYGESLTYAIETLPCHALYYGPQHPVHAVQLLRIAKLHLAVDELRDGVEVLLQALQMLRITHGEDHPLVSDAMTMYLGAREEYERQQR